MLRRAPRVAPSTAPRAVHTHSALTRAPLPRTPPPPICPLQKFYSDLGSPQPADEAVEKDAWTAGQEANFSKNDPTAYHGVKSSPITRFIEAARGSQKTGGKKDMKARFLAYDGQVLRFLVVWDDTGRNMFGEKHLYWLSYYLSSEEGELKEARGKKQFMGCPTMLKRQRLPRTIIFSDDRMRSCEDVTGDEDYFNEDDFVVGRTLNIFGRHWLIADCDPFTQQWYMEHRGLDQKAAAVPVVEPPSPRPELPVPPHPGFGREEDTIESWKSLIPKRPKTDMKALMSKGTGATRRLLAKLVTDDPINAERVFRITLYLDDGEMAVYEPKIRNSGVEGGTFMKKGKLRREDNHEYWKPADFVVGEVVVLKAHPLRIYEEERQPETPVADVDVVIHKLKKKMLDNSASLRKVRPRLPPFSRPARAPCFFLLARPSNPPAHPIPRRPPRADVPQVRPGQVPDHLLRRVLEHAQLLLPGHHQVRGHRAVQGLRGQARLHVLRHVHARVRPRGVHGERRARAVRGGDVARLCGGQHARGAGRAHRGGARARQGLRLQRGAGAARGAHLARHEERAHRAGRARQLPPLRCVAASQPHAAAAAAFLTPP